MLDTTLNKAHFKYYGANQFTKSIDNTIEISD